MINQQIHMQTNKTLATHIRFLKLSFLEELQWFNGAILHEVEIMV